MSALREKVRKAIEGFSVLAGDRVVVAVSGGADSVCLLHLLKSLFTDCPLRLHVAHLNHGLRPEAIDELRFVEALAKTWNLPFTAETLDSAHYNKKGSVQMQARQQRYRFLKDVARNLEAKWIALGHNADDQAETLLMRILRGSGMSGLSGIPAMRDGLIIRPLLGCTRHEIMEELARHGISFIEDPSNKKRVYQRNRIRQHLIPILESYNPKVKTTLCREVALLRDENHFIAQSLSAILPALEIRFEPGSVIFKIEKIVALHPALQRRVLCFGIERLGGQPEFEAVEAVRQQMISVESGRKLSLPGFLIAQKKGMILKLMKADESSRDKAVWQEVEERVLHEINASISKRCIKLPEWGLELNVSLSHKCRKTLPAHSLSTCTASFDFDSISLPLSLRSWRPGDRFMPLGLHGHHKKLQDFFVDHKLEKSERHRKPLLCCRKGILWVLGLRIDERFCVKKESSRILTVETRTIHAAQ